MNFVENRQEKILGVTQYFVEENSTVRKVGKELKIPKSTVHKMLTEFITTPHISAEERKLVIAAKNLLEKNRQERHLRGGEQTRLKFELIKQAKQTKK